MKKKINIGNMGPKEYEEYARLHNQKITFRNTIRKNLAKNLKIEIYLMMMIFGFFYICSLEGII